MTCVSWKFSSFFSCSYHWSLVF